MASERKPELVIVDTLKDKHGRTVKVGYRGHDVEIVVTPHSGHDGRIALDGEQRDRFIKAWAAAEMAIERDDAPTAAEIDRCHESTDAFHRCRVCVTPEELAAEAFSTPGAREHG